MLPVHQFSNQELSYNFWKEFNNIDTAPTQDNLTPDAVGVPGQTINELYPCPQHPEHKYTQHIFYTRDSVPKDYYNFMLMHGKAHEVHPAEREFCWNFLSRFRRKVDGSLTDTKYL